MVPDMAKSFEANLAEAMDAAAGEAVSEYTAEMESDVVDESESVSGDAGEDGDLAEVSDEAQDDGASEDVEAEATDEGSRFGEFDWDGDPKNIPDELKPIYEKIFEPVRKGAEIWMGRKAKEWGEQKAALEARLHELETARQADLVAARAPKMPDAPDDDATRQEWDAYYDKRTAYIAWKQLEEARQAGVIPDPTVVHQMAARQAALGRAQMIESQSGYSEEVGAAMIQVAQSNPYWNAQLQTDEGALALFELVKTKVEADAYKASAAKASSADLQRKASAATRKVSRPQTSPRPATPARNFADMGFDERIDVSIADALKDFG